MKIEIEQIKSFVDRQEVDFTLVDIVKGLGLSDAEMTRDMQIRIGVVLRKLGCRRVEKRSNTIRFWYRRPAQ